MRTSLALGAALLLGSSLFGQLTLPPGIALDTIHSTTTLNLPGPLGGLEFSANGAVLYCGTGANGFAGEVRAIPVVRDPVTNKITGFLPATTYVAASQIDGGLQFHPNGTLFWTTYSNHTLGQAVPGGVQASFSLSGTGIPASTGALEFVPAGLPNAGDLLIASYNAGSLWTLPLTPNGDGTFTPGTATLFAAIPGGTEGFRHIPSGPNAGSIAVVNYGLGTIALLEINLATGMPLLSSGGQPIITPFITGVPGAEGLAFDPLTNDFFVSQFGGASSIYQFSGFPALPSIGICGAGTVGLNAGGPYNVLTVNGSAGGVGRRVDLVQGVSISLAVSTPPTATGPVPFVLYGKLSDLDSAELTPIANVGEFCFVPVHLFPFDPDIFVVTDSFILNDPYAILPPSLTPWGFTLPGGLGFPFTMVFQGAVGDPSRPLGIATTNAVIMNVL